MNGLQFRILGEMEGNKQWTQNAESKLLLRHENIQELLEKKEREKRKQVAK
jgi:hypothetical protein